MTNSLIAQSGGPLNIPSDRCPHCYAAENASWASERGFLVVRCIGCGLLFVSPAPSREAVDAAVRSGVHKDIGLDVRARRESAKIRIYTRRFKTVFGDLWRANAPITWVDVGCGYGEVLECLHSLAPEGSTIWGFEPMQPKAAIATAKGLKVSHGYLSVGVAEADVISAINIFSHIPDFHDFLRVVKSNLAPRGLLFLETGNLADLNDRREFPGELGVPDHLVFAGERQIRGFLDKAGFEIEQIRRIRADGFVESLKGVVKKLMGRPYALSIPYNSKYRQLLIRARLRAS
jgi:SAM-dependent methyltransferase